MSLIGERYKVRERLGDGEEGMVERCFDEDLRRDVAVKIMPDVDRARRQWTALYDAAGEGLVRVVGYHKESGRALVVMELVPGMSYDEWLAEMPAPRVKLRQLSVVLRAFRRLHAAALAHGDPMPWNVVVTPEGRAVLIDPRAGKLSRLERRLDERHVRGIIGATFPTAAEQAEVATLFAASGRNDGNALRASGDAALALLANPNVFTERSLPAVRARAEEHLRDAVAEGRQLLRRRHLAIRALHCDLEALVEESQGSAFKLQLKVEPATLDEDAEIERFAAPQLMELGHQEFTLTCPAYRVEIVVLVLGQGGFRPPWPRELPKLSAIATLAIKIGNRSTGCRLRFADSGADRWEVSDPQEGMRTGCLDTDWYRWLFELVTGLRDFGDIG